MTAAIGGRIGAIGRLPGVRGVLSVKNAAVAGPAADGFDELLIVFGNAPDGASSIHHYMEGDRRVQERWMLPETAEQEVKAGSDPQFVKWVLDGEIVADIDGFLPRLRERLAAGVPAQQRDRKRMECYSSFLKHYLVARLHLREGRLLDAYSRIVGALHDWACAVVYEHGLWPEPGLWEQVRRLNPGVYKLYEELARSPESLEERLQLALLACEFSLVSKLEACCRPILDVIRSRERPWRLQELASHPDLAGADVEWALILDRLVKKGLVRLIPPETDIEKEPIGSGEWKYARA